MSNYPFACGSDANTMVLVLRSLIISYNYVKNDNVSDAVKPGQVFL